MNLAFPSHLDQAARDRLARVLAQAELDRLPPVHLVLRLFKAFVSEHLDRVYQTSGIASDQVRRVADEFLAALTLAVYWEYPETVRLPDLVIAPDRHLQQTSSAPWRNLRQFRQVIGEELHGSATWIELQEAIVDIADDLVAAPDAESASSQPSETPEADAPLSPQDLLAAYRQLWPDVKNAAICRAAGVYSSDFYRWRAGRIPARARLARRLVAFLKAMKAPPRDGDD